MECGMHGDIRENGWSDLRTIYESSMAWLLTLFLAKDIIMNINEQPDGISPEV